MQPGSSLAILKTAHIKSAKNLLLSIGAAKAASEACRSLHRGTYHAGYMCCRYPTTLVLVKGLKHRTGRSGWNHELQRCQAKSTRKQDLLRKAGREIQPDSLRFPTGPGSRRSSAVYVDTDAASSPGELPWAKAYCSGLRFGPQPCQCHEASWYWR